ncbi:hypothetical protein AOLI_G00267310 [Acnodon oligacanthus]
MSPVYSSPKYTTGSTLLNPYRPYDPYDLSPSYISRGHPQASRYSSSTSRYLTPSSCLARVSLTLPQEPERGRAIPRGDPRTTRRSESSSRMQMKGQATRAIGPNGHSPSQTAFPATSPLSRWRRSVSQTDLAQELATLELCEHGDMERVAYPPRDNAGTANTTCSGPFYWSLEVSPA